MGQNLTHGIYLPDEGERNCYDGLAANWQLLDNSVGTIAEHTTQIAGKAPAVHTHVKADITDFPAYGNTAGTICEGNDSRLSDARTPVAHTHSKADIADLLNSNFIPSANNSYNLGSSSYQWNNVYSKGYYYNGTAWGLDKNNTWTGDNTFNTGPVIYGYSNIRNSNMEQGTIPQSVLYNGVFFSDKNNKLIGSFDYVYGTSGNAQFDIRLSRNNANANRELMFSIVLPQSGNGELNFNGNVKPKTNNTFDLGTSTNKWKTLNGINPGALSLPDLASDGYINLSDNISANTQYSYTPTADGWLALYCQTTGFHAENAIGIFTGGGSSDSYRWACSVTSAINLPRAKAYHGAVMLPVKAGIPYLCWITIDSSTTLSSKRLYFYKTTGNV